MHMKKETCKGEAPFQPYSLQQNFAILFLGNLKAKDETQSQPSDFLSA